MNIEDLMSTPEAAERLGISPSSLRVYRMDRNHPLRPVAKIGGAWFYSKHDVERHINRK